MTELNLENTDTFKAYIGTFVGKSGSLHELVVFKYYQDTWCRYDLSTGKMHRDVEYEAVPIKIRELSDLERADRDNNSLAMILQSERDWYEQQKYALPAAVQH